VIGAAAASGLLSSDGIPPTTICCARCAAERLSAFQASLVSHLWSIKAVSRGPILLLVSNILGTTKTEAAEMDFTATRVALQGTHKIPRSYCNNSYGTNHEDVAFVVCLLSFFSFLAHRAFLA
jgi:hypothetical protein